MESGSCHRRVEAITQVVRKKLKRRGEERTGEDRRGEEGRPTESRHAHSVADVLRSQLLVLGL